MEGFSAVSFVLGGGGPMPQGLTQWSNGLLANLFAGKPGAADPALQAALLAAQTELAKNVLGQSLSLGLPARAGDPLLANLAVVIRVADADRHLQLLEDNEKAAAAFLQDKDPGLSSERNVIPGVPSLTLTKTFGSGDQEPVTPTTKLILAVVLGTSDRIQYSVGRVDEHTLLGVLGGAKELKAALAAFKPGFPKDAGVAATDALLPVAAPWRFYLNLQGVRNLIQMAKDGLDPKGGEGLPVLPAAPPIGLTLELGASGAELSAAAPAETLDALRTFIKGAQSILSDTPAARPKKKAKN